MRSSDTDLAPTAAIVDDGRCDADALLASLAWAQRRAGHAVRGLLMTRGDSPGHGCAAPMVLVDLHRYDEYLVSQALGNASTACRADPQGFARASQVLRQALLEAPDLVISNRFGGLEAEGGGFRDELLALMAAGIPLLTVVATRHLTAWRAFSGGATELPAEREPVLAWLARALPERHGQEPGAC